MPFPSRVILHVPLSDEALLDGFVEQCLADGVSLVAVFGAGCERIEDIIDEVVVGNGSDPTRFLCTSSHPDEPFEDVLDMVKMWRSERDDAIDEVRL